MDYVRAVLYTQKKIYLKLFLITKAMLPFPQIPDLQYTAMKILGIAYPKHWILLVVSKYLDEHLMQIDLLVLSN